ncbi:hypothetical protein D3C78_1846180 [compost metagenome]
MADVGTVGLAESLLDKTFEDGPLRVARQCSDKIHLQFFGLAEVQRQLNIPVEIGHWKTPPPDQLGRSIKGIS